MKYSIAYYIVKKINISFVTFVMFMGVTTLSFAVSIQAVQTCAASYSERNLKYVSFSAHFNNRITCYYTQGENDTETFYEFGHGYVPFGGNWTIIGNGVEATGICRVPDNQLANHCQFKRI